MAIVASDWTVTRATGDIRYVGDDHSGGSPSYATVIEFHRWLQGLADDAVSVPASSDELDITNVDPSRRSTDNIITLINDYNIDATAAEHLYDGSIIQGAGVTLEVWDGIVNFGNADVQIQIIQDGEVLADDWWNYNGAGLNASAAAGISHRFMIKVVDAGDDIDGRRIIGICRRFGYTYGEFSINGTSRGNNVLALSDTIDLNNDSDIGDIAAMTDIVNSHVGYIGMDVDNNAVDEYYYSQWHKIAHSINDLYERMKWLTRDSMATTLYGLAGELFRGITHQVAITWTSGTFVEPELLTWGTGATAGTGQLLAIDAVTTTSSVLYMQLLTGVIPNANEITGAGGAKATAGTVTAREISKPFCGQSTGTALIGAYGYGTQVHDLTSNDKVKNLADVVITPPNYVTNTVSGLADGHDRVLVAPWDGESYDVNGDPEIDKGQLLVSTALVDDNITSVVVKTGTETAIPSDTPASGYIRVTDDNGFERRLHYTGWTGTTFTIDTTDGNEDFNTVNASVNNLVYIAYIDIPISGATTATFMSVQTGSRDLVVIVRDGGGTPIKQFISGWTQTASNQTISAIRTTDT